MALRFNVNQILISSKIFCITVIIWQLS